MGNYNSKNSKQKIIINNESYNNQKKEEDNEIIIELEISNDRNKNEISILCDKDEEYENYYKKIIINPPKEFNYFNKDNTKLYLNDKEIIFKYKLNFNKIGINKIKIKSNIKLFSLSTMFYNCNNIINIKFTKINTNNVTDMSYMFNKCKKLSKLNLSPFNTNNVTNMCEMFLDVKNYLN